MKVRLSNYDQLKDLLSTGHELELPTSATIRLLDGKFYATLRVNDYSKWETFDTLEEAMEWLTKLE